MCNKQQELLNRINTKLPKFCEFTAALDSMGISFAHAVVFHEKYYWLLHKDPDLLEELTGTVLHGCVFCDKDITEYCDGDYYFTYWSGHSSDKNRQIYITRGFHHGLTVSKKCDNCIMMWCFMCKSKDKLDYIIKNKGLWKNFIDHFESQKALFDIPEKFEPKNCFCLENGFTDIARGYVDKDAQRLMNNIRSSAAYVKINGKLIKITPTQRLICSTLKKAHTVKDTALMLKRSPDTIKTCIRIMRIKLGIHSKVGILNFCDQHHLYV